MKSVLTLSFPAIALLFAQCSSPAPEATTETKETPAFELGTEEVAYSTESTKMAGYFAYDKASAERRPGILVVHEWWGQNDYVRKRTEMLAELGYVALAVDMYGDGATASHPEEAMGFTSKVMENMDESTARFKAAMETLAAHPMVQADKISAVGYCFGGSVALSMANAGLRLDGVAAFHSGVNLPIAPSDDVTARMLVQNGAADPMITATDAENFKNQMNDAGVELEYIAYPDVMHAYTNPDADAMGEKFELPLKYDADADAESWERLREFLKGLYP